MNAKKSLLSNLKAAIIDRETAKTVIGGYYCSFGGSQRLSCSGSSSNGCYVQHHTQGGGGQCLYYPGDVYHVSNPHKICNQ